MNTETVPSIPITLRVLRAALHALKLNAGSHLICNAPFVRRLASRIKADRILTSTPGGFLMEADVNDYNGRKLLLFGTNDWKINRTVNALLFEQDVFLDIGANYGTVGFGATPQVGRNGEVHLFEPQPDLADRLATAIRGRGKRNVHVHQLALGALDGELPMSVPTGHSGRGSLVGSAPASGERFLVTVRAAHNFVASLVGQRPFGAKIDAEGADLEIIRSIAPLGNCRFIVYEGGADRQEICRYLIESGFAVFGISRSLLVPSVVALDGPADSLKYHDAAAVRLSDENAAGAHLGLGSSKVYLGQLRSMARAQRDLASVRVPVQRRAEQ